MIKYLKRVEKSNWIQLLLICYLWFLNFSSLGSHNILSIFSIFIMCYLTIHCIIFIVIEALFNVNPVEIIGIVVESFENDCMDVTYESFILKTGKIPTQNDESDEYEGLYRIYSIKINSIMRNKCKNGNFIKFISNDNYSYEIHKLKEKPVIINHN